MRVGVIGAGSWGTTIACLSARHADTTLWARSPDLVAAMRDRRENPEYLSGIGFPEGLTPTDDLERGLDGVDLAFMAVPSHGSRAVLRMMSSHLQGHVPVVSLAKGIEQGSDLRMSEVITEELSGHPVGVLSGPNLAREVAEGHPAASLVATESPDLAASVQALLHGPSFRIYTGTDVVGCEVAGATKNVIAIASGISDGLGFGENTRAVLITRGLAELSRLGISLGGRTLTFGGLAGIGDLVATCTSARSRNRTVGVEIGHGRAIGNIVDSMSMVAEGVKSASALANLARTQQVEMPIVEQVTAIISGTTSPTDALDALMARPARSEWEAGFKEGLRR